MKTIMFNDKYCLTQAVLERRKTTTRRIVPESALKKWEIHDKYHNQKDAVGNRMRFEHFLIENATFKIGEEVAIAQAYKDIEALLPIPSCYDYFQHRQTYHIYGDTPGWHNKMFVKANLMPHSIKITDIRVERLQDITHGDCLKEGIGKRGDAPWDFYMVGDMDVLFDTAKSAFAYLIDQVSGKGTWERNPYVFVYEFELIM